MWRIHDRIMKNYKKNWNPWKHKNTSSVVWQRNSLPKETRHNNATRKKVLGVYHPIQVKRLQKREALNSNHSSLFNVRMCPKQREKRLKRWHSTHESLRDSVYTKRFRFASRKEIYQCGQVEKLVEHCADKQFSVPSAKSNSETFKNALAWTGADLRWHCWGAEALAYSAFTISSKIYLNLRNLYFCFSKPGRIVHDILHKMVQVMLMHIVGLPKKRTTNNDFRVVSPHNVCVKCVYCRVVLLM